MTDKSPYQVLGLPEDASFEDVQAARDQMMLLSGTDERRQESIEQAYDMILMQRLRLRKEGKIPVPERIRYPERSSTPEPNVVLPPRPRTRALAAWLGQWIDTPSTADVLLPLGILAALGASVALSPPLSNEPPSLQLALGVMTCVYFLYRKERRFFRSVLLTVAALALGLGLTYGMVLPFLGGNASAALFVGFTFIVMWLVTAFLR